MGATTTSVTKEGNNYFVKKHNCSRNAVLEARCYELLAHDSELRSMGVMIPEVELIDDKIIIPDCGITLADYLHFPELTGDEYCTKFESWLEQNVKIRSKINQSLEKGLSEVEKEELPEMQYFKLESSLQKQFGKSFSREEINAHFWAYRVMNALGVYDEQFKQNYTQLIGKKLDYFQTKYGGLISDNTLRNNCSPDKDSLVPFDFDSIKFGPKQIDLATVAGLFCFDGPLAVYRGREEVKELVDKIQEWQGLEKDPEYLSAFLLACFHENAVLAGYRTKKTKQLFGQVNPQVFDLKLAFEARTAFDEIEYHSCVPKLISRNFYDVLISSPEERGKLGSVLKFIDENSFGQRLGMMFSPGYQQAMRLTELYRDYYSKQK